MLCCFYQEVKSEYTNACGEKASPENRSAVEGRALLDHEEQSSNGGCEGCRHSCTYFPSCGACSEQNCDSMKARRLFENVCKLCWTAQNTYLDIETRDAGLDFAGLLKFERLSESGRVP